MRGPSPPSRRHVAWPPVPAALVGLSSQLACSKPLDGTATLSLSQKLKHPDPEDHDIDAVCLKPPRHASRPLLAVSVLNQGILHGPTDQKRRRLTLARVLRREALFTLLHTWTLRPRLRLQAATAPRARFSLNGDPSPCLDGPYFERTPCSLSAKDDA